jgi:hypothetical protein
MYFLCTQKKILPLESVTETAVGLQNYKRQFFSSYNFLQFSYSKLQINAYVQNKRDVEGNIVYRRI